VAAGGAGSAIFCVALMLVRFMVADRTPCRSARNAVMTRHVAHDAADYGAFDTAFGVRWINGGQAHRYCNARTSKERFHRSLLLSARCNKPTDARFVPIVMEMGAALTAHPSAAQ